jgi:hypothetical protein
MSQSTTQSPQKKKQRKRSRPDTFHKMDNQARVKFFQSLMDGKNDNYTLDQFALTKDDGSGDQRTCWSVISQHTGSVTTSVKSTKPYRFAMIWYTHHESTRDSKAAKQMLKDLPTITSKTGEVTRHRCGNDWCCNPTHLIIGTRSANEVDKHFHHFLNICDDDTASKFRENFADLMRDQGVW